MLRLQRLADPVFKALLVEDVMAERHEADHGAEGEFFEAYGTGCGVS